MPALNPTTASTFRLDPVGKPAKGKSSKVPLSTPITTPASAPAPAPIPASLVSKALETTQTSQPTTPIKPLFERAMTYLQSIDSKLDEVPTLYIQDKLDAIGAWIEAKFAPLERFNNWINSCGDGAWYQQLAMFLVKLPMRAVRNIVQILYSIVKQLAYTIAHPLKAANKLAKMLVSLAQELAKPETWTKVGVGIIGVSLGSAATSGNPLSIFGVVIGAAMTLAGLGYGTVKAAVGAQQDKKNEVIKQHLLTQLKDLPESFLTGFILGLIMGGIQKSSQQHDQNAFRVADSKSAQEWVDKYTSYNSLPKPQSVTYQSGSIDVVWNKIDEMELFKQKPFMFTDVPNTSGTVTWNFQPTASQHHVLFQKGFTTHTTPLWGGLVSGGVVVLKA